MERECERQIGDETDRDRDQVIAGTTDGDRRCAGVGTMFKRDAVEHRPCEKRTEKKDRAEIAVGEQMRHGIGPQALRIAVPPTVGFLVQVVKGTALASVIGFVELTKAGTMITNATFKPFTVYACVALLYFALCSPISLWSRALERKLSRGHH